METSHIFYEQHIATLELGLLHVVSEAHVSNKVVQAMMNAAEVLYHQYGAGRVNIEGEQEGASICVQYLPKFNSAIKAHVSLPETERHIYLANPLEITMFFQSHPEYCSQIYLMSDPLNVKFHHLLKFEQNRSFDDVIKAVFEQEGLLYTIIPDSVGSETREG